MKSEVKKLERGQVELTIEISIEEYQPFLEAAATKISQNTKIPGFRPGKADYKLIKQKIGENEIWQEALELAVQKTLVQTLDEQKIITVGSPKIDVVKLAPGNPVTYKATLALLPNVELGDYEKIKIEKKEVEIKKEEIEKAMSNLQKMRAKETLADKKAEKGDKLEIDIETCMDKVPIENGKQEKFPLVIGEGSFIPGFEDQVIGLQKGDTKQFQLEFPETYHAKNLAGRLADFKVKVNAVYKIELPELNDEFAKGLGQFQTIKEIEEQLTNNLKQEASQKQSQMLEEEIIDKIIEQSKFDDIPDLLIDSETKKMVEELDHNLSHQGVKMDDYLTHLKKKRADLLLDFIPQAIKRTKGALIMRKVTEEKNIKATDQDVDAEIAKTKSMHGDNPEVKKQVNDPAYRDYLKNIVTARKTIEHLKSVMVK